ncbi:unnamed protein product, partial [Polarella glacialis]
FLRPEVAARLSTSLEEVDAADGFAPGAEEAAVPQYSAGATDGWELLGPPHLRRYLRYSGKAEAELHEASSSSSLHGRLGNGLQVLAEDLFASRSFRRWLQACTGLEPRAGPKPEVRRFRPGLDYTVAARTLETEKSEVKVAELDATLVFALGDGTARAGGASRSSSDAVGDQLRAAAAERWASEEVGGFESYLAADD